MLNKKLALRGATISAILAYFIAALFVPVLNLFTVTQNGTKSFVSVGKIILTHKFKNDAFGKGLRNFFIKGIDSNFLIEFFWYAMMLQFIMIAFFVLGLLIFWLSKNNRKSGFSMLNVCGKIYIVAMAVELILVLVATIVTKSNLNFTLNFNIPFIIISVALSIVFFIVTRKIGQSFKEPKLSAAKTQA